VEDDTQITSDGILTLHHDTVVDGTPVWQLTHEALSARVGHRLSTLPEVFAALPPTATIFVEFKRQGSVVENDAHRAIVAAARSRPGFADHIDRTIIGSFDPWFLHAVGAIAPDVHRGLILERRMLGKERFDPAPWDRLRWVSFDRDLLSTSLPEQLTGLGLSTLTWSVDDPDETTSAFSRGCGVITKHPGRAARIRG
jgi:glycerophosphoryl diester phosphodiesterase